MRWCACWPPGRRRLQRRRAGATLASAPIRPGGSPRGWRPSAPRAACSGRGRALEIEVVRGEYGPPALGLSPRAQTRLRELGASRGPREPDPRAEPRGGPRAAGRGDVRRFGLVAAARRLASWRRRGGSSTSPSRPSATRSPPLQPRPQRRLAGAPLARAAAAGGGDGGALRAPAHARDRLRLPAPDPLRRGRAPAPPRPRADARVPRDRAPRRPGASRSCRGSAACARATGGSGRGRSSLPT